MSDAMPKDGKKVPIKDEWGEPIGEVTSAEFDEKTQSITFVGRLNDGMQFKASQGIGLFREKRDDGST